jgi:glycosyltransferase involved in cell wall biosynthesis
MSYGVPVIASRVGGLPEIVDEVLVDNNPEEVAAAMLRVLGSDSLATRLAHQGRERVLARHTFSVLCADTDAVYRKVLR